MEASEERVETAQAVRVIMLAASEVWAAPAPPAAIVTPVD